MLLLHAGVQHPAGLVPAAPAANSRRPSSCVIREVLETRPPHSSRAPRLRPRRCRRPGTCRQAAAPPGRPQARLARQRTWMRAAACPQMPAHRSPPLARTAWRQSPDLAAQALAQSPPAPAWMHVPQEYAAAACTGSTLRALSHSHIFTDGFAVAVVPRPWSGSVFVSPNLAARSL